jgi:hypothetical protein
MDHLMLLSWLLVLAPDNAAEDDILKNEGRQNVARR